MTGRDDDIGRSLFTDYLGLQDELTEQELDYLERTRRFVDHDVLPVIGDYWQRAEFPFELITKMAKLGIVGDGIEGYGCPQMSPTASGLINMELSRGDGSLGTFLGVQSGLAMRSIALLGSEAQKQRWLPGMAALEVIGAFALTEPEHGSDSVGLEASLHRDGDAYGGQHANRRHAMRHDVDRPGESENRQGHRQQRAVGMLESVTAVSLSGAAGDASPA